MLLIVVDIDMFILLSFSEWGVCKNVYLCGGDVIRQLKLDSGHMSASCLSLIFLASALLSDSSVVITTNI